MPRLARAVVVLVLAALLPLRAVAGVTIGFCANGHQESPAAADTAHLQHDGQGGDRSRGGGHHAHDDHTGRAAHDAGAAPGSDVRPAHSAVHTCSTCAAHCSSTVFAPDTAAQGMAAHAVSQASVGVAVTSAPVFVPDQPDRPPLA
jgi:hypothetical protein